MPPSRSRSGSARESASRLFSASAVLLLAWGVFAFGAEYSWAYTPLLVFGAAVALLGLRRRPVDAMPRGLMLALAALVACALLQLAPLPRWAVAAVSPASLAADYAALTAKTTMSGEVTPEPTSASRGTTIAPGRTVLGLFFVAVLLMLFAGCVSGISRDGPRRIARGIVLLGVATAVLQIAQRAMGGDTVYGFWYPPKGGLQDSAPFINRNHTAGWLVMALSLSAGYFAAVLTRGLRGAGPSWRQRVLWLSSERAGEVLLVGVAVCVMALAILTTGSRSGLLCLIVVGLAAAWTLRRQTLGWRRAVIAGLLAVTIAAAVLWGPFNAVTRRFDTAADDALLRVQVWQDTLRIVGDFPLAGSGLNTFGIAMLNYQTVQDGQLYIEAHNDYLQFAAEGGLLLGVPALIALVLFVWTVRRRFRESADDTTGHWLRVGAVTGLCAIAVQEGLDFTLQMPGAAALFVVLAAIAVHRRPRVPAPAV